MKQSDVGDHYGQRALRDRLESLLCEIDAGIATLEPPALERLAVEASDLARALLDERAECLAERAIAVADLRGGRAAAALARVDRVLPTVRRLADPRVLMTVLGTLGTSAELTGDAKRSDEARLEVETIARTVHDRARLGGSMADRGSFLGLRGETLAGATLIAEAIDVLRPLGTEPDLRWSLLQLSILESRLGRTADARHHLDDALPSDLDGEHPLMLTNIIGALFELAIAEGRAADAEQIWPVLLSALRTHGVYWQRTGFLESLAAPMVAMTSTRSAREALEAPAVPVGQADLAAEIRAIQR